MRTLPNQVYEIDEKGKVIEQVWCGLFLMAFSFNWPVKMQEVREAGLVIVIERTWNLATPSLAALELLFASSNETH